MNRINTKNQMIILSAALVLMVVLFYFFAWTPQLTQLEDLDRQAQDEQVKINAAKAKIAMLSEVKKNAANAEVELIKIQNKMPTDAKLPSLVVELQNMANDAGVNLVSIKPSEPKPMGEFSTIEMNLSVVGSYVSLIDFLRRVEKSARSMTVGSINIAVAQYPDLALNLTASAFTMGAAGAPATPAAAPPAPAQPQAGAQAQPAAAPTVSSVQPNPGPVASSMQSMLLPGSGATGMIANTSANTNVDTNADANAGANSNASANAYAGAKSDTNVDANTITSTNTNVAQTVPNQTIAGQ